LAAQQRFVDGTVDILCATTAFGLGVDIPDIRRVIHDYLPDGVIDHVQQSGRAGRDGLAAKCILLLAPNDLVRKAAFRCYEKNPWLRWREKRSHVRKTNQLVRILMAEDCIPAGFAAALGMHVPRCGVCSACCKGPLVKQPPNYAFRRDRHLRLWVLRWQRDALARRLKCRPSKLVSDRALCMAAEKLVFPRDADAPAELRRMLWHFNRDDNA
jgi:superfamily II DNA helicase RecQ